MFNEAYIFHSGYQASLVENGSILYINELIDIKYTNKYIDFLQQSDIVSELPQDLTLNEKYIQQITERVNHNIRKITDNKDGTYYIELLNNNKPCILTLDHVHNSNNQYIILDSITGQYIFKCHSEKCKDKSKRYYLNIMEKCNFDYKIIKEWTKTINDEKQEQLIMKRIKDYINKHYIFISGTTSDLFLEIMYDSNGKRRIYYKNKLKTILQKYKIKYFYHVKVGDNTEIATKNTTPYDIFMKNENMRSYSELTINATYSEKDYEFNTFDRFSIIKDEAIEGNINIFLFHIRHIWCKNSDEKYEYVLNWMAHCIQKPNIKTKVALVLMSRPGSGKGIIVQLFSKIFGSKYFLHCNDFETILGKFNSQLEGKFLVFLDECIWGGNKKDIGKLKTFITEETRQINKKNVPKYTVNCVSNTIIASNEDWVIPAGKSARRYFILDLDDKYCGNKSTEANEYFKNLGQSDINAIAYYLYNRDISTFISTELPHSEMLQEQQTMSLNSVESFILSLLTYDIHIIDECNEKYKQLEGWYPRKEIYRTYNHYCDDNKIRIDTPTKFWLSLKKILPYIKNESNNKMIKGDRKLYMESIDNNRTYWEKYMNGWKWD